MEDQNNNDWDWVQDIKPGIRHFEHLLRPSTLGDSEYILFYFTKPISCNTFLEKVLPIIKQTEPDIEICNHRYVIDHFQLHLNVKPLKIVDRNCQSDFIILGFVNDPTCFEDGVNGTEYFNL